MLAVVGNLARDVVAGARPRVGGAPYYAARALRELGIRAAIVTQCARGDRDTLLRPLAGIGVPVRWRAASATATFSFRYEGDRRLMEVDAVGDAWRPDLARDLSGARWVHLGALVRSDFPMETIAAVARGRRISLDGQGLVRPAKTGPLELDAAFDPAVLRHVAILKLAEEEAHTVVGGADAAALRELGVPEVVVTFGSRGSLVVTRARVARVEAHPVAADPTGSGDAFAAVYAASRSVGLPPLAAARRATAAVASLLRGAGTRPARR